MNNGDNVKRVDGADASQARKRALLIANPRSGVKKATDIFTDVKEMIEENGWDVELVFTERRGHATELAADAVGYDRIVCMGGDGTLNETINGIMKNDTVNELGYIPAGSTNDFAAGIGLPKKIPKSAKFASVGGTYPTDVGYFRADGNENGRCFSYVASFGVFTRISYSTDQRFKNKFGRMAYIFEGIRSIAEFNKFEPFRMRIELDDGTALEQDYIFGAVTNSTSLGGLMKLDKKHVHVDDGQFELLLIRAPKSFSALSKTVAELADHRYRSENIIFGHVKSVKMISEIPLNWTLDGEYAGELKVAEISVKEGALDLVRPEAIRKKPFFRKHQI